MDVLRAGSTSGLMRFDTAWFRMDLEALRKLTRCALALETSRAAFDRALRESFEPRSREVARAFLLRRGARRTTDGRWERGLEDFLAACRSLDFMDYSDLGRAHAQDRARMERYAAEDAPPPLAHAHASRGAVVRLPPVLRAIAQSTFRNQKVVAFLNHHGGRRGVPSHGARHPFDALFAWTSGGGVVEAYFDPIRGRAHRLPARPPRGRRGASTRLRLYAAYERVQWRYRHSGFYDTLLLDAGHILANVSLVASAMGWEVRSATPPAEQPPEAEPLVADVFLDVELAPRSRAHG